MSKQHPDELLDSVNEQSRVRGQKLSAPSADREAAERAEQLDKQIKEQNKQVQQELLENINKNAHKWPAFIKKNDEQAPQEPDAPTKVESDTLTNTEPTKRRIFGRKNK